MHLPKRLFVIGLAQECAGGALSLFFLAIGVVQLVGFFHGRKIIWIFNVPQTPASGIIAIFAAIVFSLLARWGQLAQKRALEYETDIQRHTRKKNDIAAK
jgi:hypothetical protein